MPGGGGRVSGIGCRVSGIGLPATVAPQPVGAGRMQQDGVVGAQSRVHAGAAPQHRSIEPISVSLCRLEPRELSSSFQLQILSSLEIWSFYGC